MDNKFQAYANIITDFYCKVLKGHSHASQLMQNCKQLIQEIQSKDYDKFSTVKLTKNKSELSLSVRSRSVRSKSHANKNIKKQSIFTHQSFGTVFAFSYLHLIISIENKEIFKMIEAKVKLLSNNDKYQKNCDDLKWEHNLMQWKKIMHLIHNKNTVKWQKILSNAFTIFQNTFVHIILCSILNLNMNTKIQLEPTKNILQKISDALKITILFCQLQLDCRNVKEKIVVGSYKSKIKLGLGYSNGNKVYHFYEKFPIGQENEQQKQSLVNTNNITKISNTIAKTSTNISIQKIQNCKSQKFISTNLDNLQQNKSPVKQIKSYQKIMNQQQRQSIRTQRQSIRGQRQSIRTQKQRPSRSYNSSNLIKKKTLMTVQFVLKQYYNNNTKLSSLSCFNIVEQEKSASKNKYIGESLKNMKSM